MEGSCNGCESEDLVTASDAVDRHSVSGLDALLRGNGFRGSVEPVDEFTSWGWADDDANWDDLTTGRGSMVWVDVPFVPGADGIVYERSEWWRG
jgi:hypothetical protein